MIERHRLLCLSLTEDQSRHHLQNRTTHCSLCALRMLPCLLLWTAHSTAPSSQSTGPPGLDFAIYHFVLVVTSKIQCYLLSLVSQDELSRVAGGWRRKKRKVAVKKARDMEHEEQQQQHQQQE